MNPTKIPTWIVGDGALHAQSFNVLVTRKKNATKATAAGSIVEYNDRWIISFDHDDGCGNNVSTNIRLEHTSFPGHRQVRISAITNNLGMWRTDSEFTSINLDEPIKASGVFAIANYQLLVVVQSIYRKSKQITNWAYQEGSPLDHDAPEGSAIFECFSDIHLPILDPKIICFADVSQTLVEAISKKFDGLTTRMNSNRFISERFIEDALRIRYDDLVDNGKPYDKTLTECVSDLVKAGLFLGASPYEERDLHGDLKAVGSTSLLSQAVDRQHIDMIESLMDCGADPLLTTYHKSDALQYTTSPLMGAALSDNCRAVLAMMNRLTKGDAEVFRALFTEKLDQVSPKVANLIYAHHAKNCVLDLIKPKAPSPN